MMHQSLSGQVAYKPLESFKGDTITYYRYNFLENYDLTTTNETLKFFFDRMEVPIKSFEVNFLKNFLFSIILYTENVETINRIIDNGGDTSPFSFLCTFSSLTNGVTVEPVRKIVPDLERHKLMPWDDSYSGIIGKLKYKTFNYQYPDWEKWK